MPCATGRNDPAPQILRKVLDAARPTAVNLTWATARVLDAATAYVTAGGAGATIPGLCAEVLRCALALAEEDVAINTAIAKYGADLVEPGSNILHHWYVEGARGGQD